MKKTMIFAMLFFLAAAFCFTSERVGAAEETVPKTKTIDDFSSADGVSAFGTKWEYFSDKAHFGKSSGGITLKKTDGKNSLCLNGQVKYTLGNGFIQANLSLKSGDKYYDASRHTGVKLSVKGNGEKYYILLKTADTRLHWQLYRAPLKATGKWSVVKLPFRDFEKYKVRPELTPATLSEVAVVAADKEYKVDVCVSEIEFY